MLEVIHDPSKVKTRTDKWWVQPLLQGVILVIFIIYTTYAIVIGKDFKFAGDVAGNIVGAHYLSPIYSPEIELDFWTLSPAFILIWIPLGFRATCYYMRRVYYRSFFLDPPACAVEDSKNVYKVFNGEQRFPFVLNNLHRYFLYGAIILMIIHWYDFLLALTFKDGIGVGLGSIIIGLDALFLTLYVVSCHAFRHMIGGKLNWFSKHPLRHKTFKIVSKLNEKHNVYFWLSLVMVVIADLYVRLLVWGTISPIVFFTI